MTNFIFCGAAGRMCRATMEIASASDKYNMVAGIDIVDIPSFPVPLYKNIDDCKESADVIIDFSHHSVLPSILAYAIKNKIAVIVATTGHTDDELALMKKAAESIPVFHSGNFSLGINLLIELAKKATAVLGLDADIEIVEAHHNKKLDAPSGTALMIANEISSVLPTKPEYKYDRTTERQMRPKNEIGIHSIRAGTIVGEHSVIFGCNNEVINISHSAASRDVFASGALKAAEFIKNKPAGLYNMSDMLALDV